MLARLVYDIEHFEISSGYHAVVLTQMTYFVNDVIHR